MKHIPQRTCVACRQVRPKRELVRIVRTPDGQIQVDTTGKANGRGVYLCRKRVCWEKALAAVRPLAMALKTSVPAAAQAALWEYARQLPAQDDDVRRITSRPGEPEPT